MQLDEVMPINSKPIQLQCPTCQTTILWTDEFPHRPFCSKRCQLVDFGEWANESNRIHGNGQEYEELVNSDGDLN